MAKILVLEDDDHIRSEIVDWLMFSDYEVISADNGKDGLRLAETESPDLIVSDIAMPGMSGHEVLLEIRSNPQLSTIPFIFVTASAERSSVRRGMDMGADDYITKPFTYDELINAVKSRLEKVDHLHDKVDSKVQYLESALQDEREQRLLKSRIVAMFSHDFRNPIAVIVSSANLMIDYNDRLSEENKMKKMKGIISASYKLNQMLDEMLMVAEMESDSFKANPVEVDISEAVDSILDEFRIIHDATHKILFSSDYHSTIHVDIKLLRQIMSNLISNAAKYSREGGTIEVSIKEGEGYVAVKVKDNGIGIPPEDIPRLFEPFKRATNADKHKGTGLGLAIVKQAIDLCNAKISVQSEVNNGSLFTVKLPK